MDLGMGSGRCILSEEVVLESKNSILRGKPGPGKGCVCVCVCVHTSKIGLHLNMLKRGEKIHIAKRKHT